MPPKPTKKPVPSKQSVPAVRKKSPPPDGVEVLLKERLAEITTAVGVFKEGAGLVEKYKAHYPKLLDYEPTIDLNAHRITFKQTMSSETPELAVFELRISEHGAAFTARRAGKGKEDVGAEDWSFYLPNALAGIVAAILYAQGKT
jgi:hypothetical protein